MPKVQAPSPMLLFDTNVARALRDRSAQDLKRFWLWVYTHHRYAIAPTVVAEVLNSLRLDPEPHIESVRRELSALRGPWRPIILPLQGIFLGKTLFGIQREHPHLSAATLAQVLDTGRKLHHVERMQGGRVLLVSKKEPDAIILDYIVDPIVKGQQSMFAALERTKALNAAPLEPDQWAARLLEESGLPATPEAATVMAKACTAAYALQRFLWTQAVDRYNPVKHAGDWLDGQLLLYLAYERTRLVTCEKQLLSRIKGSGQEDRVVRFEALWEQSQAATRST